VSKTYQTDSTDTRDRAELALPESVTVALTDLAGEAREGLLALAVGTGLQFRAGVAQTVVCDTSPVLYAIKRAVA
jgi:hypothetical protein